MGCDPGDWIDLAEDRDQGGLMKGGNKPPGYLKTNMLLVISQNLIYQLYSNYVFSLFLWCRININILNSCPTQGRVEGWDVMKPRYCRSVNSKGAGRPRLTHHHKGWWNETKWMRWVWRNDGKKFVVGENGRNPEKNLPRPRFVHHETHTEGPRRELRTPAVGGERLTDCATRPRCRIHIRKS